MSRHPDPDQTLFRFTWHDETDDRPDAPGDDLADDDGPPGPRRCATGFAHGTPRAVMRELWRTAVVVGKAPAWPVV